MSDKADFAKLLLKHGYTGIRKIGEGSFGVAVLVQDSDGAQSVCKSLKVGAAAYEDLVAAKKEARLLAHLRHPNIVRYRTSFLDWGWFCIVMDYCDGGSLSARIERSARNGTPIPEDQIVSWVAQIVMALEYLHDKGILHRDLKPGNMFLSHNDIVVGDFGLSKVLDCTMACAKTLVGTPYYLSPEVIQDKPYFWPSDIWSVGCIIFELSALRVPFEGANLAALAQKICSGPLPEIPPRYSAALRELCLDLMTREPEDRPCASAILRRPFILENAQIVLTKAKNVQDENPKAKNVVLDIFRKLDLDGDGVLDRSELSRMLKHLDSEVWCEELIDELLHSLDFNADGLIQFDEFVHWVFGRQDDAGLVGRCQQHMKACLAHIAESDLASLRGSLLQWRQSVDLGCLSILPPSTCVETCDTITSLASDLATLPDSCEDAAERADEIECRLGLLDQMSAILYGVEQLLLDYGRHHVRRVIALQSSGPAAVVGLCFELEDGTRLGQCQNGFDDANLKNGGGTWQAFAPGEQIIEVKGFGCAAHAGRAQTPAEAAPAAKARGRFSIEKAAAKAKANAKAALRHDRRPSSSSASARPSTSPDANTSAIEAIGSPAGLAAAVTLCTSRGRELKFGAGSSDASLGIAFNFKAPEGQEIEDVLFKGGTCTGILAAPTAPVHATWDFWDKRKIEKLQAAFRRAARALWSSQTAWSWQKGERRGKYALLQARRFGLPDATLPEDVQERQHTYSMSMIPPSFWDVEGFKPEHGNIVSVVKARPSEHSALQEMLRATSCRRNARSRERAMVPTQFELVHAVRIQNWQCWANFQAQQEVIATDLESVDKDKDEVRREIPDLKTAGFLDQLRLPLDDKTNTAFLFHGLSSEAVDLVGTEDFDIDKAGLQTGKIFGRGVYFSECCSRADEVLSTFDETGMFALLVCRVILGKVLVDSSPLPDVARNVSMCMDGQCHSVLGENSDLGPRTSRELVVYDKDQVYPEFMLVYRRVYG